MIERVEGVGEGGFGVSRRPRRGGKGAEQSQEWKSGLDLGREGRRERGRRPIVSVRGKSRR